MARSGYRSRVANIALAIRCTLMVSLAGLCLGQSCTPALTWPVEDLDEQVLAHVPPAVNVEGPVIITDEPGTGDGENTLPDGPAVPEEIKIHASGSSGSVPFFVSFEARPLAGSFPESILCEWQLGADYVQTSGTTVEYLFSDAGSFQVSVCVQSEEWPRGSVRCAAITVVAQAPAAPYATNLAPGAFDSEATTGRNVPVQVLLSGADPEGETLSFSISSGPLHGAVGEVIHTAPDAAYVIYTPSDEFLGVDELLFQVSDGAHDSLPGKVRIEVINSDPPPVRVVVVPALHRVFREDTGIEGSPAVAIKTARGETESCQLVLVNYGTQPLKNINLSCTLRAVHGTAASPTVTPFRVHYVEVQASAPGRRSALGNSPNWSGPGWYPDALIPFTDPYTGAQVASAQYKASDYELPAAQCQPYWLDFHAPADAPAGKYEGAVQITADGFRHVVPVELEVWDFGLPTGSVLPVLFGCSTNRIAGIYGTGTDAASLETLRLRHVSALESHRIFSHYLPMIAYDAETGHARIDAAYLSAAREKIDRNQLRACCLTVGNGWPIPDPFGSGWEKFKTYMRDIDGMLRDNPWIPPTFVYMVDEPNTALEHEQVYQVGQFFRSENLIVKNFVPGSLREVEGWAPLEGSIDVWVYHWGRSWDMAAVTARQAAGYQVWSYSALANGVNGPSWLLDAPLLDYTMPFWASWSLQLDGLVYWTAILECNQWGVDPWLNPATLVYPDGSGGKLEMNGEGLLLMPGLEAGVDGPLPTIRLKAIRDGLDCYNYLQVLADRGGRAVGDEIAREVAASYRDWNPDYRAFVAARERLAEEIMARPGN